MYAGVKSYAELDKILEEKFNCFVRSGFTQLRGYTVSNGYKKYEQQLENFEVRNEDVWVCTYPRSGTTWMLEMVWLLKNNLDFEKVKEQTHIMRCPFIEETPYFENFDLIRHKYRGLQDDNSFDYISALKNPRVIKCHAPWELLPNQIRDGKKKPKIIYVSRNPKDACTSYYHLVSTIEGYTGTFEEFCKLFLNGRVQYTPYHNHTNGYISRKNEDNILHIQYEDMLSDLPAIIKRVAAFLEVNLHDDDLERLKKYLDFKEMKKNPHLDLNDGVKALKEITKSTHEEISFFRKGQAGDHSSLMSPEMTAEFDRWIIDNKKA